MAADRAAALGLPTLPDDPEAEAAFERAYPDRRTGRPWPTLEAHVGEEPSGGLAASEVALRPCGITIARVGVARVHGHLPTPPPGALAAVEVVRDGWPIGWALVGRPRARALASRWVEVTRVALAERGTGAPSRVYSWCARWARARHRLILTYTLEGEDGASLRASGWLPAGWTRGGVDLRHGRRNVRTERKQRWIPPYCRREARRLGWIP